MTGWGRLSPIKDSPVSENLMKLRSSYLPSQKCYTKRTHYWHHLSHFCTIPDKYAGICGGEYQY